MSEIFLENTENYLKAKTCESCGKHFSCGANLGKCWCFEIDLSNDTLAKLQADFKSCLCEDCLAEPLIRQKSARTIKEV